MRLSVALLLVVTLSALAVFINAEDDSEIVQLQFLFRHGDRTPISTNPTDNYHTYDWPDGLQNLIAKGKARMYGLGQAMSKRYAHYIAEGNFFVRNVKAISSPIRRCLETNEAFLAGMFPPNRAQIWAHSPNWMTAMLARLWNPIGIETQEEGRSWLLNPDARCDVAKAIDHKMNETNDMIKSMFEKNKDFVAKVKKESQYSVLDRSWRGVGYLYDNIYCEANYFGDAFKWPQWLKNVGENTYEKLKEFNDLNFRAFGDKSAENKRFLRFRTGLLIKQLNDTMYKVKGQKVTAGNRELYAYSSHDVMISYLLHVFDMWTGQPTFGSGLIFELHRSRSSGTDLIHLFYVNSTNNYDVTPLDFSKSSTFQSNCGGNGATCTVEGFANSLAYYTDVKPAAECGN